MPLPSVLQQKNLPMTTTLTKAGPLDLSLPKSQNHHVTAGAEDDEFEEFQECCEEEAEEHDAEVDPEDLRNLYYKISCFHALP